jgi:E3 ubiquitin-protein ligase RNF144
MHSNIGSQFRQCNGCGIWVERANGCAKMTCRCGHRFCFVCGTAEGTCGCTPRYHMFYPLQAVLSNWNNRGPS